jgi:hypothetical protein
MAQVAGTPEPAFARQGQGFKIPSPPRKDIAGQTPDSGGRYSLQIGARAQGQHQGGKPSAVACDDVKNPVDDRASEEFTSSVSESPAPSRSYG